MKSFLYFAAIAGLLSVVSADSSQCLGECPEQFEGDYVFLMPHKNCSVYCACDHGHPYELPCPENLHYSPNDHVCTYPWQAECATEGKTSVLLRSFGLEEEESLEEREYLCMGTCPADDLPDVIVTLEHQDCGKFCKCIKGYGQERECPTGFHFSPHLGVCTYPYVAQCFRVTTTPAPTTSHDCCPCSTTPTTPTTTPTKPTTTPTTPPTKPPTTPPTKPTTKPTKPTTRPTKPTTKPTTTPTTPTTTPPTTITTPSGFGYCIGKCPPKDPVLTIHLPHTHCSKFCKCSNGTPYIFKCQPGLYFNPKLQVCDVPVQAGCQGIKD